MNSSICDGRGLAKRVVLGEDTEWIEYDTSTRFESGMFVAKVQGDSMAPAIPNGAYCLFRKPPAGARQGKRLLVRHSGIADSHTGGQYSLKVYSSEKVTDGEGGWRHTRIVLKPLNPDYEPIELTPADEGKVQVIAEFVEGLGKVMPEVIA